MVGVVGVVSLMALIVVNCEDVAAVMLVVVCFPMVAFVDVVEAIDCAGSDVVKVVVLLPTKSHN